MLNRRNALTAVATLPALAAPAAAPAMGYDAELLRLGEDLDQLIREYTDLKKIDRQRSAEFDRQLEALTGVPQKTRPDIDWENPTWVAYSKAMDAVWAVMPS